MQEASQAAPDAGIAHVSESTVQRRAEQRSLELAGQMLGVDLVHRPWAEARMTLPGGARVDVDATALTRSSTPRCSPARAG